MRLTSRVTEPLIGRTIPYVLRNVPLVVSSGVQSQNRTVVVVPSFLILLAKSHVERVIVARPFTFFGPRYKQNSLCEDLVFL